MTKYWIKIVVGALLIFIVGTAAVMGVRKGVRTVHTVFETADPITIPIKIVNFRVDGTTLGRVQKLTLLRTAPKSIASVQVTVRLDSAALADRIRHCTMRVDDVEHIDERTTFVCVSADPPGVEGDFEAFGQVRVEGTDIVLPLSLPVTAVREFQNQGWPGADSLAPVEPPPVPQPPSPKSTVAVP
jgi:hypothetical protein